LINHLKDRRIFAWALYDWANSAFATTIMAGLFPVFFKEYWSQDLAATSSTFYLGLANSCSGILLIITAPLLGAMADRGGYKKEILFVTTMIGVFGAVGLYFVPAGEWRLAAGIYTLAAFGFSASMTPYDSLLVDVSAPRQRDVVSGLGYAFGYLGGGLLFLFNVIVILKFASFGIPDKATAVRLAFLSVGFWWLIFSLPLFIWVKEHKSTEERLTKKLIVQTLIDLKSTALALKADVRIGLFLLAYFFYIEGVNTTIKIAVDYGLSLGFSSNNLITALLIVQFVAFPFAILFGWLGHKLGAIRCIYFCLLVYLSASFVALRMQNVAEFYLMAVAIGTVQGGVQALSRSYFAELVPAEKSGQYFGFYNMLGKFSAVLGPILIGLMTTLTGNPRSASFVLLVFFGLGMLVLSLSQRRTSKN